MYIDCWLYSKTCLKQLLKKEDHLSLNAGQTYCRHSAILSTFIKLTFVIKVSVLSFLSGCFRHVLLYWYVLHVLSVCGVCRLAVRWIILLKWDFFTTKKDGSTGPTFLESDGLNFEIMGQWPGPTINLKTCLLFTNRAKKKLCDSFISSQCAQMEFLWLLHVLSSILWVIHYQQFASNDNS